jgi:hypothetical protein
MYLEARHVQLIGGTSLLNIWVEFSINTINMVSLIAEYLVLVRL